MSFWLNAQLLKDDFQSTKPRYSLTIARSNNFKITLYFQELYEESVRHLSEAVTILQVEPEEKEEIQNEMAKLSKLIESEMED